MTTALIIAIASLAGAPAMDFDHTHSQLSGVLSQHVHDGLVDYAALKEDRATLDGYLDTVGAVTVAVFQRWGREQQLAYLINIYNATTLRLVIDHYPVGSIKSIGSFLNGPWDKKIVNVFGKTISLNTLEHKIIRKRYAEPRIHFSLVCAAVGCPPLRDEAYQGEQLERQLEAQTVSFLAEPKKNRIDSDAEKLFLSPIFKWYRKDFEMDSGSLKDYLNPYLAGTDRPDGLREFDITFTDYDWSLNDRVRWEE
jgi:hypothetical protein